MNSLSSSYGLLILLGGGNKSSALRFPEPRPSGTSGKGIFGSLARNALSTLLMLRLFCILGRSTSTAVVCLLKCPSVSCSIVGGHSSSTAVLCLLKCQTDSCSIAAIELGRSTSKTVVLCILKCPPISWSRVGIEPQSPLSLDFFWHSWFDGEFGRAPIIFLVVSRRWSLPFGLW